MMKTAQLARLILQVWNNGELVNKYQCNICIIITDEYAHCLYSDDQKHTKVEQLQVLHSNHEETNSRVVLYDKYAEDQGYESVCASSPDSDVFFVLLQHRPSLSCNVIFDTRTGNNKCLINMTNLGPDFTLEYCTAFTVPHVFTHCDSTGAFKGLGNVKPI